MSGSRSSVIADVFARSSSSVARNAAVPNVPTYGEMGFPNVYSGSWVASFAPAKTPDAIIARLNAEINAVIKDAEVLARLKAIGFDPIVKNEAEMAEVFQERDRQLAEDGAGGGGYGGLSGEGAGRRGGARIRLAMGPERYIPGGG